MLQRHFERPPWYERALVAFEHRYLSEAPGERFIQAISSDRIEVMAKEDAARQGA